MESPYGPSYWPATANLFHSFNWSAWDASQGYRPGPPPVPALNASALDRLLWLLGDAPSPTGPVPDPGGSYPPQSDLGYVDALQGHDAQGGSTTSEVTRMTCGFGPALNGNLYFRSDMRTRQPPSPAGWPAVVWLHSSNYNKGYVASYPVDALDPYHYLANASAVVLTFERLGHGLRLQEGAQFYDRWPRWSKLGRMVHDAISAVDLLTSPQAGQPDAFFPSGEPDALQGLPLVNPRQVFLAGYGIGSTVALATAALDPRVAGVATVSGWTPLRVDTDASPSGGIRRWWQWHATSPRLGWYAGNESSIPVEYDDVLSLIAPRPVLTYTPQQDRMNNATAVQAIVAALNADGYTRLQSQSPQGTNALNAEARQAMAAWLQQQWDVAATLTEASPTHTSAVESPGWQGIQAV